jgi:hypothetical protein
VRSVVVDALELPKQRLVAEVREPMTFLVDEVQV